MSSMVLTLCSYGYIGLDLGSLFHLFADIELEQGRTKSVRGQIPHFALKSLTNSRTLPT